MYLILFFLTSILRLAKSQPLITDTASGVSYQGNSADGVEQFLGIPYGEDTSGLNRFAPPKPHLVPPGSVIDATHPGAACPQAVKSIIPPMSDVDLQNENCLNLRIARPAATDTSRRLLPVMVFFHGGGSILGSIYDRFYNPVGIVQQSVRNDQPVVYVAMNYRLGIFGFPAAKVLKDQKSENLGLRDQILALEWIRDNIATFGGDPENVTLFGQSFGSISIGLLVISRGGQREALFHKAIMASGSLARNRDDEIYKDQTAAVAQDLGCDIKDGVVDSEVLSCMREASLADVARANLDVATKIRPPFGFAAFSPVIDDDLILDQPSKLLAQGRFFKNISLIVTWTFDEWGLMVDPTITTDEQVLRLVAPRIPNYSASIGQEVLSLYPLAEFEARTEAFPEISAQYFRASRIISDTDPVCPLLKIVQQVSNHSTSNVYVAELNETRMSPYWDAKGLPWGICHISDIPYIFNEWLLPPGNNSEAAFALGAQYAGSFVSFANTGNPVTKGQATFQDWPQADISHTFGLNALIIGGLYGTGPVSTLNQQKAADRSQIPELKKRDEYWRDGQRNAAFASERLVERCSFYDSLGVFGAKQIPH